MENKEQASPVPQPEPTVGRMLHFFPCGHSVKTQPLAAQIAFVHGPNMVNLGVLNQDGSQYSHTSVRLLNTGEPYPTDADGRATEPFAVWMAYQLSVATAAAALANQNRGPDPVAPEDPGKPDLHPDVVVGETTIGN